MRERDERPDDLSNAPTLHFPGCAGMYHFYFGVAAAVQREVYVSLVNVEAVSGSAYPALCLLLQKDEVRHLYDKWMVCLHELRRRKPRTWLWHLYDMAYVHTRVVCGEEGVASLQRRRLRMAVISVESNSVSPTHSVTLTHCIQPPGDDDAIMDPDEIAHWTVASGFIPFLVDGRPWYTGTHGNALIDGSLEKPSPPTSIGASVRVAMEWEANIAESEAPISARTTLWWRLAGFSGQTAEEQYARGYRYFYAVLLERLREQCPHVLRSPCTESVAETAINPNDVTRFVAEERHAHLVVSEALQTPYSANSPVTALSARGMSFFLAMVSRISPLCGPRGRFMNLVVCLLVVVVGWVCT